MEKDRSRSRSQKMEKDRRSQKMEEDRSRSQSKKKKQDRSRSQSPLSTPMSSEGLRLQPTLSSQPSTPQESGESDTDSDLNFLDDYEEVEVGEQVSETLLEELLNHRADKIDQGRKSLKIARVRNAFKGLPVEFAFDAAAFMPVIAASMAFLTHIEKLPTECLRACCIENEDRIVVGGVPVLCSACARNYTFLEGATKESIPLVTSGNKPAGCFDDEREPEVLERKYNIDIVHRVKGRSTMNYYYYVQQGERRRLQDIVNVPVLSELTRQTLPGDTRIRDLVHKLNTEKEDDMLIIGALYGFPMLTTLSMILGGPGNSDEPPSIRAAPRNAGAKGGISDDDD